MNKLLFLIPVLFLQSGIVQDDDILGKATIEPNKTQHFDWFFAANKQVKITVSGNGKSNLDCELVDFNSGQILMSDYKPHDLCVFDFFTTKLSHIKLNIINNGKNNDTYLLSMK